MIITENPVMKKQMYDNIRETVTSERTGIHLSDLIYCSRKAYFRKMGMSPPPSDVLCVLWMTGYAFQNYMFPKDEEIPITIDGINCTPDIPSGIEVKSTRMSSKRFDLDKVTQYKRQILGYCKALNKLEYDLVVLFVCGNYAPPFPDVNCWHIETTQEEVDANWNEVLQRAVKIKIALMDRVPPEPDSMDWEWEYCENIEYCQDTVCYRKKQMKGGKKR